MNKLHQFSLKQLSELLNGDGSDEQLLDGYLSENLIIARNPPVQRLLSRLSGDTYVLPEMRVIVLTHGHAQPTVNLMERRFEAGDAIFLSHSSIVKMGDYATDIRGFGLSLTDELVSLIFPTQAPRMLSGDVRDFVIHLTPDELQRLNDIHALLHDVKRNGRQTPQVLLHLAAAFLWQVDCYWSRQADERRAQLSREQRLFTDFVQLVSRYATQQHNIDFYAQRLFLSPRYMSTLVKQVSGKAAKQWIDEAIVTRIKVELRHSDKSVAQIADEMCFANPSFFSKYFRRMTGLSPAEFRTRT